MELNLENLSVEDLKALRTNINLLLKDKCKPKYEGNTFFIKPGDLFFIRICYTDNDETGNTLYRININNPNGDSYYRNVEESFIDECLPISEEVFDSLVIYRNKLIDQFIEFRNEQDVERFNYKESLTAEFSKKLQEIINDQK